MDSSPPRAGSRTRARPRGWAVDAQASGQAHGWLPGALTGRGGPLRARAGSGAPLATRGPGPPTPPSPARQARTLPEPYPATCGPAWAGDGRVMSWLDAVALLGPGSLRRFGRDILGGDDHRMLLRADPAAYHHPGDPTISSPH